MLFAIGRTCTASTPSTDSWMKMARLLHCLYFLSQYTGCNADDCTGVSSTCMVDMSKDASPAVVNDADPAQSCAASSNICRYRSEVKIRCHTFRHIHIIYQQKQKFAGIVKGQLLNVRNVTGRYPVQYRGNSIQISTLKRSVWAELISWPLIVITFLCLGLAIKEMDVNFSWSQPIIPQIFLRRIYQIA